MAKRRTPDLAFDKNDDDEEEEDDDDDDFALLLLLLLLLLFALLAWACAFAFPPGMKSSSTASNPETAHDSTCSTTRLPLAGS